MTETLHYTVEGEFITNFARDKLLKEQDFDGAIKILMSCLMTDQLSEAERYSLALEVLDGSKRITGVYPYADYGVCEEDPPKHLLRDYFTKQNAAITKLRSENNDLLYKYLDLCDRCSEDMLTTKVEKDVPDRVNIIAQYEGNIFSQAKSQDDLMGFIEPDGTFHQVDWCHHSEWAKEYLDANYDLYGDDAALMARKLNGELKIIYNTDVLIYSLHWVLLDNPYYGIPSPTYDESYGLTKKQKEVLFDFYMATKQPDKARQLYE